MRILSGADVSRLLPMGDAIRLVRDAFAQLSSGRAHAPLRTVLDSPWSTTLVMPAGLAEPAVTSVKIVSVAKEYAGPGPHAVQGVVALLDPTGIPMALLEASRLTAIRTGAATGVATDLLARRDASTVAILGAGVQARTQLEAVATVRNIREAWVYAPTRRHAEAFAEEFRGRPGMRIHVAASARQAVREAQVVCAATRSTTPVFAGVDLRPGTHVNGVGSFTAAMQETDLDLVRRAARVVVDHRVAAFAEAGELIAARDAGLLKESETVELGDVVLDGSKGRLRDDWITFFKSVGIGVQDAAVAAFVVAAAERADVGSIVPSPQTSPSERHHQHRPSA